MCERGMQEKRGGWWSSGEALRGDLEWWSGGNGDGRDEQEWLERGRGF